MHNLKMKIENFFDESTSMFSLFYDLYNNL